jgi:hypothetical protein
MVLTIDSENALKIKDRMGVLAMLSVREYLQTTGGKAVAAGAIVLCIAAAGWSIWANVGSNEAVSAANDPWFVDAATGKPFHAQLKEGMSIPIQAPSGQLTGYMAELCYWTKDGHPKTDPTPVLMNADIGKSGPTFCPDCGRLVVPHNPPAIEGHRPPPTREEYEISHHYP